MKRFLLPHLICPTCLPKEHQLLVSVGHEKDGDISTGYLSCAKCKRRFPIKEGIALLLPDPDGCLSGGRITFEMAARSKWAVGCDLSQSFVKTARRLARDRKLTYSLHLEGNLRETFIQWKMRSHCNHCESFKSDILIAARQR